MCYPTSSSSLHRAFIAPIYFARDFARQTSKYQEIFRETVENTVEVQSSLRLKSERFKNGIIATSLVIPIVGSLAYIALNKTARMKQMILSKLASISQTFAFHNLRFQFYLQNLIEQEDLDQVSDYESLIHQLRQYLQTLTSPEKIQLFSNNLKSLARFFVEEHFYQEVHRLEDNQQEQVVLAMNADIIRISDDALELADEYQSVKKRVDSFLTDFDVEDLKFSYIKDAFKDIKKIPDRFLNRLIIKKFISKLKDMNKEGAYELYRDKKREFFREDPVQLFKYYFEELRNNPYNFEELSDTSDSIRRFIFDIFDCGEQELFEEQIKLIKELIFGGLSELEEQENQLNIELNCVFKIIDDTYTSLQPPKDKEELRKTIREKMKIKNLSGQGFQVLINREFENLCTLSSISSRRSGKSNSHLKSILTSPRKGRSVSSRESSSSDRSVSFSSSLILKRGSHYSDSN